MFSFDDKNMYRDNRGKVCPYCKSNSVNVASKRGELKIVNNDRSTQEMKCLKCKKRWIEIYPMFDIEEL